jgi:hypothetical protein
LALFFNHDDIFVSVGGGGGMLAMAVAVGVGRRDKGAGQFK